MTNDRFSSESYDAHLKPWQVKHIEFDIDQAREAFIGPKYEKYQDQFDRFDESEKFQISFLWPPLIIGWLWLAYRKLYLQALLFLTWQVLLGIGLPEFPGRWAVVLLLANVPVAMAGAWLLYNQVEGRIEKAMASCGGNPLQAIGWLHFNGGVNLWVVPLSIIWVLYNIYINLLVSLGKLLGSGL